MAASMRSCRGETNGVDWLDKREDAANVRALLCIFKLGKSLSKYLFNMLRMPTDQIFYYRPSERSHRGASF